MEKTLAFLVTCCLLLSATALKLPDFVKKCSLKDPEFNACALKNAREALPHIVNGLKKFQIPVLDPLIVEEIRAVDGQIDMAGLDVKVEGIRNAILENISFDFDQKKIAAEVVVPETHFSGRYEVKGKLLSLPLSGNGPFNSTFSHYIKPCSRNDPDLNACAKQHAIQAIPQFINGDPKYKVPPLDPILIEELSVAQGSSNFGLFFLARNATLWGLKDVQVQDVRIDLQKHRIEYDLFFPAMDVQFRYNVSGKVLILPIRGDGQGNIVLKDSSVNVGYDYDRVRKESNGKEYVLPKDLKLSIDAKGMTIRLENLFNGDKFLGDNMNTFLNENWKDVLADVGPTIGEAMAQVITIILSNIFQLVPYDEAFPDKV